MKILLPAIALTGLAVILLGVRVLFVRGGKFPDAHACNTLRHINNKKKQQSNQTITKSGHTPVNDDL